MIISQGSLFRRLTPWFVYALLVSVWIGNPVWLLLPLIAISGWITWRISQRLQQTSLFVEDGTIVIVNAFFTHRVPIEGASIKVGGLVGRSTGNSDLNREIEAMSSRTLYIVPADRKTEMIEVSAAQGLMPGEFSRVVSELQAAIDG